MESKWIDSKRAWSEPPKTSLADPLWVLWRGFSLPKTYKISFYFKGQGQMIIYWWLWKFRFKATVKKMRKAGNWQAKGFEFRVPFIHTKISCGFQSGILDYAVMKRK
jgi:hypothetical protein